MTIYLILILSGLPSASLDDAGMPVQSIVEADIKINKVYLKNISFTGSAKSAMEAVQSGGRVFRISWGVKGFDIAEMVGKEKIVIEEKSVVITEYQGKQP